MSPDTSPGLPDVPDDRSYGSDVDAKIDAALVEAIALVEEKGDDDMQVALEFMLAAHYGRSREE